MLSLDYVAGFFDGEGCITIRRSRKVDGYHRMYDLRASISNTDFPILEQFHKQFDGNLRHRGDWTKWGGKKPQWEWAAWGDTAADFIKLIRPHLTVKEPEAWLALEFMEQRTLMKSGTQLNNPELVIQRREEYALRDGFYWALREAKQQPRGEVVT